MFGIKRKRFNMTEAIDKKIFREIPSIFQRIMWPHPLKPEEKLNSYPCNNGLIITEQNYT